VLLEMIASGFVATVFLDVWQLALNRLTGLPISNWSLTGRWFVQASKGVFFHKAIAEKPEAPRERLIGWIGHYVVGIGYGFVYVPLLRNLLQVEPGSWLNGLIFGIASVVVPWFFFMPAMGAGVMGRNTPNPLRACLMSMASHIAFGLGLAAGVMIV